MNLVSIICWVTAAAASFSSWLTFDAIIKTLHMSYPSLWRSMGMPAGWFYYPKGIKFLEGRQAAAGVFSDLIFSRPAWSIDKPDIIILSRRFRFSVFIFFFAALLWIILLLIQTKFQL